MKEIIIATKNEGKVKDFKLLFKEKGVIVKSLLDIEYPFEIEETGTTFKENAIIKAQEVANYTGNAVIADDSGLSVDALDGRPGVYSARYGSDDMDGVTKVLHELERVPNEARTARFHCALALAQPSEDPIIVEGTCEGKITHEPRGLNGFGYDPIFFITELNKTMAELSKEEKNKISHRADALKQIESKLFKLFK
jgi:XTP/dITP diphosphohydrolase